MKTLRIAIILLLVVPVLSLASSAGVKMMDVKINITDMNALQRGAKYYTNYCMGCHSIKFMSYKKLQKDLKLTEEQVKNNLMMSYGFKKKMSDYMTTSMSVEQGKKLFGKAPPDLSTITRAKEQGPAWLYTYLMTFYVDPSRPYGMNNLVFKDVGMPHVLAELQGNQIPDKVHEEKGQKTILSLKLDEKNPGSLKPAEYKEVVKDLVTFMAYVGEPNKAARHSLGVWVILFLVVFTIIAYMLKKEYWKDVH